MVMVRLTVGFKMKQTRQMKSAVNVLQNGYLWNHSFEVNYGAFMRELCGRAKKMHCFNEGKLYYCWFVYF